MPLSGAIERGLASAGLLQILLDVVCLGLSAAVGGDALLGRALIALSGANILLTVLIIGKYEINTRLSWLLKCASGRSKVFEWSIRFRDIYVNVNRGAKTPPNCADQ